MYIALTVLFLAALGYYTVEIQLLKDRQFIKLPLTDPENVKSAKA